MFVMNISSRRLHNTESKKFSMIFDITTTKRTNTHTQSYIRICDHIEFEPILVV